MGAFYTAFFKFLTTLCNGCVHAAEGFESIAKAGSTHAKVVELQAQIKCNATTEEMEAQLPKLKSVA